MTSPLFDFGKAVKDRMDETMKVYAAGHKEGYKLGFAEGVAEAKKIIEKTLGPLEKTADESFEPGGNWV